MARREQAPAALVGEGQRDELDIHGYLNLEFAVDDEHSHTGNWGR